MQAHLITSIAAHLLNRFTFGGIDSQNPNNDLVFGRIMICELFFMFSVNSTTWPDGPNKITSPASHCHSPPIVPIDAASFPSARYQSVEPHIPSSHSLVTTTATTSMPNIRIDLHSTFCTRCARLPAMNSHNNIW